MTPATTPGPGGTSPALTATRPSAIGPSGVGSQTTTTVPAAIGPIERKALNIPCVNDDDGSIGPAKRHQSGSSGIPIERKAHVPRRLAYDDDGGTNGRKALTNKQSHEPRRLLLRNIPRRLAYDDDGGPGDDHPAQLIVRTQKRLEAEEVPSQLKSA